MLSKIEQWIDLTNLEHQEQRVSCCQFFELFKGFYSFAFLQETYFVIVDKIPKPDFPELRQAGLSDFIDMPVQGITYKNTYYVVPEQASNLRLHFHELVHVAQWKKLGALEFMQRYLNEIKTWGYHQAPLEKMAYTFDAHFSNRGDKIDIPAYVAKNL